MIIATVRLATHSARYPETGAPLQEEIDMKKGIILWLLGVPLGGIVLLKIFGFI